jgi:hypothetical protein
MRERVMKFDYMTILAICIGVAGVFFLVNGYQTSGTAWIALGAGIIGIAYIVWRNRGTGPSAKE